MYIHEIDQMKKEFESVEYFCATADIWSTKHKSFLGVTLHWIDDETLERKSKALCCRRFESPHNADRIAVMLSTIYDEFNILSKVICTVTDNASNFVKAFKEFGISMEAFASFMAAKRQEEMFGIGEPNLDDIEEPIRDENQNIIPEQQGEQLDFVEIEGNVLSDHFRCASHTFCLIASADAKNAHLDAEYAAQHESAINKVNDLYKKTNKPKSSEIIKNVLKKALILPVKTRWNSLFDSVEHILSFELKTLNTLMLALDLPQFTSEDYEFLGEYVKVMEPIATAVDNLQSSNSYYAIFLPTLHSVLYDFDELEKLNMKYCKPLLESVKAGFKKRFKRFFVRNDEHGTAALIASVSHPHFKRRWMHKKYQSKSYSDYIREKMVEKAIELSPNIVTNRTIPDADIGNGMKYSF